MWPAAVWDTASRQSTRAEGSTSGEEGTEEFENTVDDVLADLLRDEVAGSRLECSAPARTARQQRSTLVRARRATVGQDISRPVTDTALDGCRGPCRVADGL